MSYKEYTQPSFLFPLRINRELFTDCTIRVGSELLRSHRVLLCACSDDFSKALSSEKSASIDLEGCELRTVEAFLDFLYTGKITLTSENFSQITVFSCNYDIKELIAICSDFIEMMTSTRSCLALLRELHSCLSKLPKFLNDVASLMEKLSNETDFSFMDSSEFKLLISKTRFRNDTTRDEIVKNYIEATGEDSEKFSEFIKCNDEETLKTDYSIFCIKTPPEVGLIHDLKKDITVYASGMLSGRDPSTVIEENPKVHWFTESDGCPWLLIDFGDIYVQPTDYAIWSHGGCSTLRSWCFQGSNDRINWVVLSDHNNDNTIKEPFSTATWPVNTNRFFRFFRVIQTGNNWSDNNWMYMRKIEIWGVACTMEGDEKIDNVNNIC